MDKQKNYVKVSVDDVAKVLRDHRLKNQLTQKDVADKLDISQSNFSKMENGLLQPSAIQWMIFCQVVGISTETILQQKRQIKGGVKSRDL